MQNFVSIRPSVFKNFEVKVKILKKNKKLSAILAHSAFPVHFEKKSPMSVYVSRQSSPGLCNQIFDLTYRFQDNLKKMAKNHEKTTCTFL